MTQPVQSATMTIQELDVSVHTRDGMTGHAPAVVIDGHAGTTLVSVSLVLTPGEARRIGRELMSAAVHTRVGSGHAPAVVIDGHAGTTLVSVSLVLTPGEARRIGRELMSAADRITTAQIGAS